MTLDGHGAQKTVSTAVHDLPYAPAGRFVIPTVYRKSPIACRKSLSGIVVAPVVFLWNVEKR